MLLVRTPAREQGTSIPSVTEMPSPRSSTLLDDPDQTSSGIWLHAASRSGDAMLIRGLLSNRANRSRTSPAPPAGLRDRSGCAVRQSRPRAQAPVPKDASLFPLSLATVNQAFRDVIAVAPPALGRPLHIEWLTICVEDFPASGLEMDRFEVPRPRAAFSFSRCCTLSQTSLGRIASCCPGWRSCLWRISPI